MSKDVTIKNPAFLFKKRKIDLNQVLEGTNYVAGYHDPYGRFREEEDDQSSNYVVVYDADCINLGVRITEMSSSKVCMQLPLPCTKQDIDLFAYLIKRIAALWNVKKVEFDDGKEEISALDSYITQLSFTSMGFLKGIDEMIPDKEIESFVINCAMLPISISVEKVKSFSEDYQAFSEYLHDLQSVNAFYSVPQLYQNHEGGYYSIYTVIQGAFILPDDPFGTIGLLYGSEVECENASVVFIGANVEEEGENASMTCMKKDFKEFIESVPESHKQKFDESHTLYYDMSYKLMLDAFDGQTIEINIDD